MTDTPIRFMAWDNDAKRIILASNVKMNPICSEELESLNKQASFLRYELMQLTALRSINDEPIYNHMIVKEEKSGDLFCVDMFYYNLMAWLGDRRLEIVGNRFQRPDLLELCKN